MWTLVGGGQPLERLKPSMVTVNDGSVCDAPSGGPSSHLQRSAAATELHRALAG